jgi:predicted nucleic acid-binding protein
MVRINGYLLDTNIITYLAKPNSPQHHNVKTHLSKLCSDEPVMLSVISIAEIEFGIAKSDSRPSDELKDVLRKFFESYPGHLGIDDNTVEPYSLVRAQLWRKYGGKKKKVPEDLFEKVTGKRLGIDERDLLIASVAIQYGLVLVTADKKMKPIIDAARELEFQGKDIYLRYTDWTLPI